MARQASSQAWRPKWVWNLRVQDGTSVQSRACLVGGPRELGILAAGGLSDYHL